MGGGERTDDGHLTGSCAIFAARCGHKTKRKAEENEQWDKQTKFDELHDCVAINLCPSRFSPLGRVKIWGLSCSRAKEQYGFGQEILGVVSANNGSPRQQA